MLQHRANQRGHALRLDELLRRTAERYADQAALIFFDRGTSYRALDAAVDRVSTGLQRLGLERGERVALFMPNCPQLVIAFYGGNYSSRASFIPQKTYVPDHILPAVR